MPPKKTYQSEEEKERLKQELERIREERKEEERARKKEARKKKKEEEQMKEKIPIPPTISRGKLEIPPKKEDIQKAVIEREKKKQQAIKREQIEKALQLHKKIMKERELISRKKETELLFEEDPFEQKQILLSNFLEAQNKIEKQIAEKKRQKQEERDKREKERIEKDIEKKRNQLLEIRDNVLKLEEMQIELDESKKIEMEFEKSIKNSEEVKKINKEIEHKSVKPREFSEAEYNELMADLKNRRKLINELFNPKTEKYVRHVTEDKNVETELLRNHGDILEVEKDIELLRKEVLRKKFRETFLDIAKRKQAKDKVNELLEKMDTSENKVDVFFRELDEEVKQKQKELMEKPLIEFEKEEPIEAPIEAPIEEPIEAPVGVELGLNARTGEELSPLGIIPADLVSLSGSVRRDKVKKYLIQNNIKTADELKNINLDISRREIRPDGTYVHVYSTNYTPQHGKTFLNIDTNTFEKENIVTIRHPPESGDFHVPHFISPDIDSASMMSIKSTLSLKSPEKLEKVLQDNPEMIDEITKRMNKLAITPKEEGGLSKKEVASFKNMISQLQRKRPLEGKLSLKIKQKPNITIRKVKLNKY